MPPSRKTPRFLTHRRNRDTKPVVAKQMTDANSLPTRDSQYALRKLHPIGIMASVPSSTARMVQVEPCSALRAESRMCRLWNPVHSGSEGRFPLDFSKLETISKLTCRPGYATAFRTCFRTSGRFPGHVSPCLRARPLRLAKRASRSRRGKPDRLVQEPRVVRFSRHRQPPCDAAADRKVFRERFSARGSGAPVAEADRRCSLLCIHSVRGRFASSRQPRDSMPAGSGPDAMHMTEWCMQPQWCQPVSGQPPVSVTGKA